MSEKKRNNNIILLIIIGLAIYLFTRPRGENKQKEELKTKNPCGEGSTCIATQDIQIFINASTPPGKYITDSDEPKRELIEIDSGNTLADAEKQADISMRYSPCLLSESPPDLIGGDSQTKIAFVQLTYFKNSGQTADSDKNSRALWMSKYGNEWERGRNFYYKLVAYGLTSKTDTIDPVWERILDKDIKTDTNEYFSVGYISSPCEL